MAEPKKRRGKTLKVKKPDPISCGTEITDVFKRRWIFGKQIGSGGHGVVYEGSDGSLSSFDFVIKVECHENGPLYTETHVYHAVGKQSSINQFIKRKNLKFLGIPVCHSTGSFDHNNDKCRYIVLPKFGKDLQKVLKENDNTLHPKTVFTVGCIVINALEYLHGFNYVHQDIKAENLMLGRTTGTENHVFLVDMGLATRYMSKNDVHKDSKRNPGRAHNGTPEFVSRDGHNGVFSRRSDLEILGYNMLLWLSGTLPWISDIEDVQKLQAEKERWMSDVPKLMKTLFSRSSYPELENFLTYVTKLKFEEAPDYDMCIAMFKRAMKSLKIVDDGILILKNPNSSKVSQDQEEKSSNDSSEASEASNDESEYTEEESSQDENSEEMSVLKTAKEENTGNENEGENTSDENEGENTSDENEGENTPDENEGENTPNENEGENTPNENEGENTPNENERENTPDEESDQSESSDEESPASPSCANSTRISDISGGGGHSKLTSMCNLLAANQQLDNKLSTPSDIQSSRRSRGIKTDKNRTSTRVQIMYIKREKLRSLQNIELSLHNIDLTLRKMLSLLENSLL